MSKLEFDKYVIDLGSVKLTDKVSFSFALNKGVIEGVVPGCPCTQTVLSKDKRTINGVVDITMAVGANFPGGPAAKTFLVAAEDGVPTYAPNDEGVFSLNAQKELTTLKFYFTVAARDV